MGFDFGRFTDLPVIRVPNGADSLRYDAAAHRLIALNRETKTLSIVDTNTQVLVDTMSFADPIWGAPLFNAHRAEMYAVSHAPNSLSILSIKERNVVANFPFDGEPRSPGFSRRHYKLYVPLYEPGTVAVVDVVTQKVIRTVKVGNNPVAAVVEDKSGLVFVVDSADKQVRVIDSRTDTVTARLPIDLTLSAFPVISNVYAHVYLADYANNVVHIVDAVNNLAIRQVAVNSPLGVTVNPDSGEIYVIRSDGVAVIDEQAGKVTSVLELPFAAEGYGHLPSGLVLASRDQLMVLSRDGFGSDDKLTVFGLQGPQEGTAIATEFHHAGFDHYFHTASETETRVLRDGAFGGAWNETFEYFRVWTHAPFGVPVCRLSATFGDKSSHFYTPYEAECESLKQGVWRFEESSYRVALPDANGRCSPGLDELYRAYNNSVGGAPNHRVTPSRATRDSLKAEGWTLEGSGSEFVFACTPSLKGLPTIP